jgi:hypothetical protein
LEPEISCVYFFSGGVYINVVKNESVEVPETGKVGGGIERTEKGQVGSIPVGSPIGVDAEVTDFRSNEQDVKIESLERGKTSSVLVKTKKEEYGDDGDDDDDDEEEEDDDDDDDDDDNDNDKNDKVKADSPRNSSEKELGETKEELKEDS